MPVEQIVRRASHDASGPSVLNGYAALAKWTGGSKNSIGSLKGSWQVPAPPTSDTAQTIYLFIGMETDASSPNKTIIQPVLQWGAMGLRSWTVASYCVCGRPGNLIFAAVTNAVAVVPGDHLTASISLETHADGSFGYLSQFDGISGTALHMALPQQLVQAGIALEGYNVTKPSDLPNADLTRFGAIGVGLNDGTMASPVWTITDTEAQWDVRAVAVTHGNVQDEIDVYYR